MGTELRGNFFASEAWERPIHSLWSFPSQLLQKVLTPPFLSLGGRSAGRGTFPYLCNTQVDEEGRSDGALGTDIYPSWVVPRQHGHLIHANITLNWKVCSSRDQSSLRKKDWAVSCQCADEQRPDEPIHRECEGQQGGESWRFDAEGSIWNSGE